MHVASRLSLLLGLATSTVVRADYLILSPFTGPSFVNSVQALVPEHFVDLINPRLQTPTLRKLQSYDAVYITGNGLLSPSILGNLLAQYVDGGGRVVLGSFTTATSLNGALSGAIMTPGYSPVTSATGTYTTDVSTYAGDGRSALRTGVTSYEAMFRDDVSLQGGGIADGTFADGMLAAAFNPSGSVIYLGGMDTVFTNNSRSARLLANALQGPAVPGPVTVPEPVTVLSFSAAVALASAVKRRA